MEVKGRGICLIPDGAGIPCGKQIEDGAPGGTVMSPTGALHGHKPCADGWYSRKAQQERLQREAMVKLAKQGEPGGFVDVTKAEDAVIGSTPLMKPEDHSSDPSSIAVPSFEPHKVELNTVELAKLDEYKKRLLSERQVSPAQQARVALGDFLTAVSNLSHLVTTLVNEYDKVVAERDEVRSERDTAKGTSS